LNNQFKEVFMRITVVGGTRGLGKWIANFLKIRGYEVIISGRNKETGLMVSKKLDIKYVQDNTQAVSNSDIIIISVPIESTIQVIREISPFIKKASLLLDVTSVKEKPTEVMYESVPEDVEVLPSHPMFGPRIRSLDGQVVVLTPLKKGEWFKKTVDFLKNENARVLVTTPEIHDQMMSIVQGLTHFAYLSIAATINKLQVEVKESRKFASPIYNLMLDMIARIVAQNPYLSYSIQKQNKYIQKIHETFLATYEELKDMIAVGDEEGYVRTMVLAAKHLDDLEAALGRSDKAISALTEEVRLLSNSLNEEVGLRHIYSEKIHFGILKELSPDYVTLFKKNQRIRLKLSNIEILSASELLKWKLKNFPKKTYDVSAVFSQDSNPEIIAETIKTLDDVVDAIVVDMYQGSQIPSGSMSITIKYRVINPKAKIKVENLLKGFGAFIR
jgi:prephenate dehydrogenase